MLLRLTLLFVLFFTLNSASFPHDVSQSGKVKAVYVSGNYYVLQGGGVNVGVSVGGDGILIVDDHYASLTDDVRAALKGLGSDTPEFILNTHLHGDHTGGNESFGETSHIIAHKNVRKRLAAQTREWDTTLPPMPEIGLPVITFEEGLSFHFNGEEIKVIHFPEGHTDGDAIVHFTKSNVLHLSDQYFQGRFPFIDLENGGNVSNYSENLSKIIDMMPDDIVIIPGHGNVSNIEELKEFHNMLIETITIVWNQMSRHLSLEDIIKRGLPKKYKKWSWGFVPEKRWITTVYDSYKELVGQ